MVDFELLKNLEGLQTVNSAMQTLGYSRQSVINLFSRLKKECHLTVFAGGNKVRIYKITIRKQRRRDPGMFDIINRYSPKMKLNPWYDHQVHGPYGPEEALIDAVKTRSFRVILASLRLFSHVKDWKKLHDLAIKNDCWQEIGAMYDVAKKHFRVRAMPDSYDQSKSREWKMLSQLHHTINYPEIQKKWFVHIPFNEKDVGEIS